MLESEDRRYINSIRFFARQTESQRFAERPGELIAEIVGLEITGKWLTFNLEPGEQILGIHGSTNSAPNLRALGFTVWKTNMDND